jgi:hypothetical protein
MATFTGSMTAGLSTSDGITLSKVLNGQALNAKALLDDAFGPGPISVDLAPLMASIADPKFGLMMCDGEGAQLKFDGVATFTVKAYKTLLFECATTPSGALDLELQAIGASQRVRFLGMGD